MRAVPAGWRHCCLSVAAALMLAGCAAQTAYTEGQELLAAEQVDAGLARIQEAIKLEPGSAEYRIAYARAQERYVKASLEVGERALAEARYEAADGAFRRALVLQAGNERALTGLQLVAAARRHDILYSEALAAWSRADGEAALASLRTILAANPQHPRALDLQRIMEASAARVVKESVLAVAYRKPISIEFKDTPLKTVFEVISRTSGLNFVFDKDLRADQKVTIFLRNSTIEAAINLVLLTNQLEQRVLDGNSILIYPNTPLKQRDYQALTVRTFYLANSDAKTVATTLKTILKSRDIVVDEKLNLLMIRDSPEAVRVAEKLVALQDVPEPEVMLEVEILEVKRSRLRDLGVNWPNNLALTPLPSADGGQLTLNDLRNLNSSTIGATVGPVIISANQADSDVNLLANPRIRARNREKAKILIGERVPNITSTATSTGFVSESITYIDVGLKLDIEPTIYLDNEVAIKVTLEVSNIIDQVETKSGTVAYRIGTRTATSVLRLKDGENQLLAGLISDEDRRTADKVPFLGDIPVLGRLFGGHREEGIKTEIVLSITPRVLRNIQRPEAYLAEFDGGTESNFRSRPAARGAALASASGVAAPSGSPLSLVGLSAGASGARSRAPGNYPAETAASSGAQPVSAANSAGVLTAQDAQTAETAQAAVASGAGAQLLWQGPTQLGTGDSFSLQLVMQADQPVVSLPLAIAFDPRVVQVADVSEGGFLRQNGGETSFTYRVDPGGQVLITGTRSGAGGATLQDVVATLNFRAVAPGDAKIELITIAPVGSGGSAIKAKLPPAHPLTVVQ
ncbi:general secretion pathway protein GspD [Candidatus Accumulibacter phosphatis]|jgi:general secretion pathway protein D|uniref:General secretion pathway protein GspD n=1 Tax=Candidatus Accumulibacter phosphatis TaxID=327160 RepID=A0ABX1TSY5_9PROT|nr:secretin N-terminal domain-containing protein [Candidatus Accumulibacter phosphatis]NMQ27331.1 general secretion pathway protein GspD [Candidatus Accumulibacter phosphatis]